MRKNKREDSNEPGEKGVYYCQKKCFICGKLIWGSSPKNHRSASKDCYFRMKAHQEEHEKEAKQLNLPIADTPGEQVKSVKRISLRGEERSV